MSSDTFLELQEKHPWKINLLTDICINAVLVQYETPCLLFSIGDKCANVLVWASSSCYSNIWWKYLNDPNSSDKVWQQNWRRWPESYLLVRRKPLRKQFQAGVLCSGARRSKINQLCSVCKREDFPPSSSLLHYPEACSSLAVNDTITGC